MAKDPICDMEVDEKSARNAVRQACRCEYGDRKTAVCED